MCQEHQEVCKCHWGALKGSVRVLLCIRYTHQHLTYSFINKIGWQVTSAWGSFADGLHTLKKKHIDEPELKRLRLHKGWHPATLPPVRSKKANQPTRHSSMCSWLMTVKSSASSCHIRTEPKLQKSRTNFPREQSAIHRIPSELCIEQNLGWTLVNP